MHLKEKITNLLKKHRDVFTWTADEVVRVLPELMIHKFNVDPLARPVKQKRRHFDLERSKVISEEVDKLLPAKMIKMVKKDTGE